METLELSDNGKLFVAIFVGLILGGIVVKSLLATPEVVKDALRLRNGRLINTVLLFAGVATLLFFVGRQLDVLELHVRTSYLWATVFGGLFCGVGLAFCGMTPLTAIAATASGKVYALWAIVGMGLAYPVVHWVSDLLSKSVYLKSTKLSGAVEPSSFWEATNPALYIAIVVPILLVLIHFTVGDNKD